MGPDRYGVGTLSNIAANKRPGGRNVPLYWLGGGIGSCGPGVARAARMDASGAAPCC